MSIRDELVALRDAATGLIKVEAVYTWAEQNPRSEIYRSLEWDDGAAAYNYRIDQIRRLITLHIRDESGRPEVVSLSVDRVAGGGYRLYSDIQHIESMRTVLLADALKELERIQQKYSHLQELVSIWREADRVRRRTAGRGRRRAA